MGEYRIFDASELDYDAYTALQKEAFADLLAETGSSDQFMTPEYFRWKYNPPSGTALIALYINEGKMVASTAMFPLKIRKGSNVIAGWQPCDVSTLIEARGRGHFFRCAKKLEQTIQTGEFFFGFPNNNARPVWEKIGWTEAAVVTTWVKPLPMFSLLVRNPSVKAIDGFGSDFDKFIEHSATNDYTQIDKNSAYLNWRYRENPTVNYQLFLYESEQGIQGYAVARTATALGRSVTIIMEIFGIEKSVENSLFSAISKWAVKERHPVIVMFDSNRSFAAGISNGFIPVWSKLLPKNQVLMGKAFNHQMAEDVMYARWRVQMGDWDAF